LAAECVEDAGIVEGEIAWWSRRWREADFGGAAGVGIDGDEALGGESVEGAGPYDSRPMRVSLSPRPRKLSPPIWVTAPVARLTE